MMRRLTLRSWTPSGWTSSKLAVSTVWLPLLGTLWLLFLSGCSSIEKTAVNKLADALASGGDTFTGDDDPELIGDALPFALKTQEILLAESPDHEGLLLATCKGFTLYGYAFVEMEADRLEQSSYRAAKAQRARALKLYQRGHRYCRRVFDLRFPGQSSILPRDPFAAMAEAKADDVPMLYWTGLSWGAAISLAKDQPEIVIDLPSVRALFEKALELDEDFDKGALHEAMVAVEGVPQTMGGSVIKARKHFDRAVELNGDTRAGPYVGWAASISVDTQDRQQFEDYLQKALAIDPEIVPAERLTNLIQQQRARLLLDQIDDLFLPPLDEFEEGAGLDDETGSDSEP